MQILDSVLCCRPNLGETLNLRLESVCSALASGEMDFSVLDSRINYVILLVNKNGWVLSVLGKSAVTNVSVELLLVLFMSFTKDKPGKIFLCEELCPI